MLYPDLVVMARALMADPANPSLVHEICDRAHRRGICLEDAVLRYPKTEGFSLNSNRGLGAMSQVSLSILAWRRQNGYP